MFKFNVHAPVFVSALKKTDISKDNVHKRKFEEFFIDSSTIFLDYFDLINSAKKRKKEISCDISRYRPQVKLNIDYRDKAIAVPPSFHHISKKNLRIVKEITPFIFDDFVELAQDNNNSTDSDDIDNNMNLSAKSVLLRNEAFKEKDRLKQNDIWVDAIKEIVSEIKKITVNDPVKSFVNLEKPSKYKYHMSGSSKNRTVSGKKWAKLDNRIKKNNSIKKFDKKWHYSHRKLKVKFVENLKIFPKRSVGCDVLYNNRFGKRYYLLDTSQINRNQLIIRTNHKTNGIQTNDIFSSSRNINSRFIISKFLSTVFDIYTGIPYKIKRKMFNRIRTLLLNQQKAVYDRLTCSKQDNRRTKTFIRFSWHKTIMFLGIYQGCKECGTECASVKSMNRAYCHKHDRLSYGIKKDTQVINDVKKEGYHLSYSSRTGEYYWTHMKDMKKVLKGGKNTTNYRWISRSRPIIWGPITKRQQARIDRRHKRDPTDYYRNANLRLIKHYKKNDMGWKAVDQSNKGPKGNSSDIHMKLAQKILENIESNWIPDLHKKFAKFIITESRRFKSSMRKHNLNYQDRRLEDIGSIMEQGQ